VNAQPSGGERTARRRIARGDIWLCALDPTVGSEIQKTRPCLIISPAELHDFLRTVIAAPLTTGSHPAHYRVPVTLEGKDGRILLDQIRALDKRRLLRRLSAASAETLAATLATLRELFGD